MRQFIPFTLAAVCALYQVSGTPASAQATVTIDQVTLVGQARISGLTTEERDDLTVDSLAEFPVDRTLHESFNFETGESASGQIDIDAQLSQDGEGGTVTGALRGDAMGESFSEGNGITGQSHVDFDLGFTVAGGSATFEINGLARSTASDPFDTVGRGSVRLIGQSGGSTTLLNEESVSPPGGEVSLDEMVVLEPGEYVLSLDASAFAGGDDGGKEASGFLDVAFTITPRETPFIRWNTEDGDYDVEENWEPEQVPGPQDNALFDRASSYVVALTGATTNRAEIVRGDVLFRPGALTLAGTSLTPEARSLVVGSSSSDLAELFLENATLNTVHSAIGRDSNANGSMIVGIGGVWNNTGRLSVGLNGRAELRVLPGGSLTSAESRIGDGAGSNGAVIVGPIVKGAKGLEGVRWEANNLAVGIDGSGRLEILQGSVLADLVVVGNGIDGNGSIDIVGGGTEPGELVASEFRLGVNGEADTTVRDGGALLVFGDALIGAGGAFQNTMTLEGTGVGDVPSQFTVQDHLSIGRQAFASIVGSDGAAMESDTAAIGEGDTGDGTVVLTDTTWTSTTISIGEVSQADPPEVLAIGRLFLGNGAEVNAMAVTLFEGSLIAGNATIVTADLLNLGGTIQPDLFAAADEFGAKQPMAGATLTIDGNLDMVGGILQFDMGGAAAGATDALVVTGDATLDGATIRMNFVDGYLPATGDTAPLLMAGGDVAIEDLVLEFEGVAEGFDFDVVNENGMLMFEALNDARATTDGGPRCASLSGERGHRGVADGLLVLCAVALLGLLRRRGGARVTA